MIQEPIKHRCGDLDGALCTSTISSGLTSIARNRPSYIHGWRGHVTLGWHRIALTLLFGLTAQGQTLYVPGGAVGTSANGNVGIGTSNPDAKLHVEGQIAGGFGANTTGGVSDWSDVTNSRSGNGNSLLLGSASNGPGPNHYFHPFNFEYGSKDGSGSITQLAIPYSFGGTIDQGIWMRGRYWSDPWGPWMRIISENAAGKVGIGTTSPVADLHVFDTSSSPSLAIDGTSSANPYLSFRQAGVERAYLQYTHTGSSLNFYAPTYVILGGNVGIGTTTPAHKLSVNGTIRAKELIVDTGWADYVFADNYRLAPLHEVEAHIKKHRHLPGIPSATEVAEQGVSLGEMQTLMMAKIEELTLHAIEQARRIERLEHENRALQGKRTQGGK